MNHNYPTQDVEGMDPQLISASLCYLITMHAKGHPENLAAAVMQHLHLLVKINEYESPEAVATYRKLMEVWKTHTTQTVAGREKRPCDKITIH